MRQLSPFDEVNKQVSVMAEAKKIANELIVRFEVQDVDNQIVLPKKESIFSRTHELWKFTCFECFFAVKGLEEYWELNLDHHGNWNLYNFKKYRQPSPPVEEKRVKQLELEFLKKADGFELQGHVDLKDLNLEDKPLEVSLNCVIEWKGEENSFPEKSYYALKHLGNKPDFHLRKSFVCSLE